MVTEYTKEFKASIEEREKAVFLINDACNSGARQAKACALFGYHRTNFTKIEKNS